MKKNTFYQKLYQTEFVDLIETNNFANLCLFHILNLKKKNISYEKMCGSNL